MSRDVRGEKYRNIYSPALGRWRCLYDVYDDNGRRLFRTCSNDLETCRERYLKHKQHLQHKEENGNG